jgi:hypothetical protein
MPEEAEVVLPDKILLHRQQRAQAVEPAVTV